MSSKYTMHESTTPILATGHETGLQSCAKASSSVVKRYNNIVKAQEDKRLYRGLMLRNRMKVLLVSDTKTDKAAVALDVNVGYLNDPIELPGLAILCQHMLMPDSEAYPEENAYTKFLSEHGGNSNASTSSDHTTYHFDVLPAHLDKALDIFVKIFTSPESAMSCQLNSIKINSAHQNNSDTWRMQQLMKNTFLHKDPYCNKDTLETIPKAKNIDVRQELLKFHRKWYSSNIMTLVVLGKESLDELEAIVESRMSSIEDKSVTSPIWSEHPFPPELRGKKIYYVPVEDIKILTVVFPIPDIMKSYKNAPGPYLSYIVGHQGPGGLLAALRSREWCTSFEDSIDGARGFSFFRLQMTLTEEGLTHIDEIVHMLFQYLAMLRAEGPQRWVWKELQDIKTLEFRFKDIEDPRSMVENHVRLLQDFPIEDVLSAPYLMTEWNPELIVELLSVFTPDNLRVMVTTKNIPDRCKMTEPWFGIKYCQEDINENLIKEWSNVKVSEELHLPPPNEFIPSNLSLVSIDEITSEIVSPILVKDTPLMRLWYKQDTEFLLPKAWVTFDILSPLPYADPLSCNLTLVWVYLLKDNLQQLAYASQSAGILWKIDYIEYGITVTIEGFNDKQPILLDRIMDHIMTFRAEGRRFQTIKQNYIEVLSSMETDQQHDLARCEMALYLADLPWNRYQLLETAKDITVELLNEFTSRVTKNVHIEGFIFGNFTKDKAIQIADSVEKKFQNNALL